MIKTYDVATIRKDFPIFDTGIAYLDSANTSQRPRQVTGAMMEYFEKFNSNIHRAAYRIAEEATERYEATREKVRDFINASSTKEIIYTRGTTEATNLVATKDDGIQLSSAGQQYPRRGIGRFTLDMRQTISPAKPVRRAIDSIRSRIEISKPAPRFTGSTPS